jgi:SET domain-containing protein
MLTVKTFLAPSNISGTGCFATEFIVKDSVIWKLEPNFDLIITTDKFNDLPKIAQDYLSNFAYYNEFEGGYVLCSDNAKYFNHSDNPNCVAHGLLTIATMDIQAGEEITEDYFNFDELAKLKLSSNISDQEKVEYWKERCLAAENCMANIGELSRMPTKEERQAKNDIYENHLRLKKLEAKYVK